MARQEVLDDKSRVSQEQRLRQITSLRQKCAPRSDLTKDQAAVSVKAAPFYPESQSILLATPLISKIVLKYALAAEATTDYSHKLPDV